VASKRIPERVHLLVDVGRTPELAAHAFFKGTNPSSSVVLVLVHACVHVLRSNPAFVAPLFSSPSSSTHIAFVIRISPAQITTFSRPLRLAIACLEPKLRLSK
jgi:hypothetical protein